jgi:hypothetical protein
MKETSLFGEKNDNLLDLSLIMSVVTNLTTAGCNACYISK